MQSVLGEDNGTTATNNHISNTNAGHLVTTKQFDPISPVVMEVDVHGLLWPAHGEGWQNNLRKLVVNSLF